MSKHHDPAIEELIVSETTPQGTQANGVDAGHEPRDIFVKSVLYWIFGLYGGTALVMVFLVGLFAHFNSEMADPQMPSPLFASNQTPPKPRLEGYMPQENFGVLGATYVNAKEARDGTPEELAEVRGHELTALGNFGLKQEEPGEDDPNDSDNYNRRTQITDDMVAGVAAEGPKTNPPGFSFGRGDMSDASGGTVPNQHR